MSPDLPIIESVDELPVPDADDLAAAAPPGETKEVADLDHAGPLDDEGPGD